MRKWTLFVLFTLLVLFTAGCFSSDREPNQHEGRVPSEEKDAAEPARNRIDMPDDEEEQEPSTAPSSEDELQRWAVQLVRQFESLHWQMPVGMVADPLDVDVLYVIEKMGKIMKVNRDGTHMEVFLDITDRVHSRGLEQGLLGLTFHPDYETNGYFYVNYTTQTHTRISRFAADPARGYAANRDTETMLLSYRQPHTNHNGGDLKFGADGMLYISSGDGGGAGDPYGNSQNLKSLLGKLLRIDVDREENGKPYAIPKDNPFYGRESEAAPEIYAYGLRNPWRFSFDEETGLLWAADVGQHAIEEINLIESGGNYGWNIKEGSSCYEATECEAEGLIDPIYEYDHSLGQSITGGYVYRGTSIPGLVGKYVYGDFMSGRIWALELQEDGTPDNMLLLESGKPLASFGVDGEGELYAVMFDGEIYKLMLLEVEEPFTL